MRKTKEEMEKTNILLRFVEDFRSERPEMDVKVLDWFFAEFDRLTGALKRIQRCAILRYMIYSSTNPSVIFMKQEYWNEQFTRVSKIVQC